MKRWQLELMGVMLLTLALVLLWGLWDGIQMVVILWLAGRGIFAKAAGDRPLRVAVRIVIAALAAVGCLLSIICAGRFLPYIPDIPGTPRLLLEKGPIAFVAFSGLLLYWFEDAYAIVPLKGSGRAILRALVSLILASFAAVGFALACLGAYSFAHPEAGPVYAGWMAWKAWVLLFLGFAVPLYAIWKQLSLRDHRVL